MYGHAVCALLVACISTSLHSHRPYQRYLSFEIKFSYLLDVSFSITHFYLYLFCYLQKEVIKLLLVFTGIISVLVIITANNFSLALIILLVTCKLTKQQKK
jgi:hypothetical protein